MNNLNLNIKMANQLLKNYESGEVPLANTVQQIHYWVKSCPEAFSLIPPESPVTAELQKFQWYQRQIGIDLLSIDRIVIRRQESVVRKLPLRTLFLSCIGNASLVIEDATHRSEVDLHIGLSTYGRMERVVVELCKGLAEGQLGQHSFDANDYNEIALGVDSGEGVRQVSLWRYSPNRSHMSPTLIDFIQLSDEIISNFSRCSATISVEKR